MFRPPYPRGKRYRTLSVGGWVCFRAGLDGLEKSKVTRPAENLDCPARSPAVGNLLYV